jgi:hypothetical protein
MILPDVRVIETTYRAVPLGDDLYRVTVYPRGPAAVVEAMYRFDMLPPWMQDAIKLLDTAGAGYKVPNIGMKIGTNYWIEAVDKWPTSDDTTRLAAWCGDAKPSQEQ